MEDKQAEPATRSVSETTESSSQGKRSVRFSNIFVRKYDLTIGDNPSCDAGTPISLDWSYTTHEKQSIDDYEEKFHKPTLDEQFSSKIDHVKKLSQEERKELLRDKFGYSNEEIEKASISVLIVQRQRAKTVYKCMKAEHQLGFLLRQSTNATKLSSSRMMMAAPRDTTTTTTTKESNTTSSSQRRRRINNINKPRIPTTRQRNLYNAAA